MVRIDVALVCLLLATPVRASMPDSSMPRRPLDLPMARDASGTSWQPDATPMYALHWTTGAWTWMVHGAIFVGHDAQGSERGSSRFVSQNWLMGMVRRSSADLEIEARVMLSAEPLTAGGLGYPLLFQTGETYRGAPLHDFQHPHDLFMETSVVFTAAVGPDVALQLYVAPAGEPALGPVAYPHRASAASNPPAPLGHHWQDATHVTYGVLTAGVFTRYLKVEGSWFNGREPDENRYNFDLRVPDSFSGRLTVNPGESLSMQVSYGFLKSPEAMEPDVSVHRATASASFTAGLGPRTSVSTTAACGVNASSTEPATVSYLLESEADLGGYDIVFGRGEYVQKTGRDLVLAPTDDRLRFGIGSLTLGYVRQFGPIASLSPGLGFVGSVNAVGDELALTYGTRFPIGGIVFVRLRRARMESGVMPAEHHVHGRP
jgi:hypothetical protein